jgi:hypothetical protein
MRERLVVVCVCVWFSLGEPLRQQKTFQTFFIYSNTYLKIITFYWITTVQTFEVYKTLSFGSQLRLRNNVHLIFL